MNFELEPEAYLLAPGLEKFYEFDERSQYETSLIDFASYVWPVVEPAIPFVRGWALDAIAEHLGAVAKGDIRRLLVNVSPGFTKSLLTSVFFPAWIWGPLNRPHTRFLCASYSEHLTVRDNLRCRNIILSDRYQRLWKDRFGVSVDQFTKIRFANDKTGWKFATSVGGIGTGERGDIVICFPYDEIVQTSAGPKKIGDVVEKKEKLQAWSLDFRTGLLELKPIIGWHKNPSAPLVRIKLSSGGTLTCTENHRILTESGYRSASELGVGDFLFAAPSGMLVASSCVAGSQFQIQMRPGTAVPNVGYGAHANAKFLSQHLARVFMAGGDLADKIIRQVRTSISECAVDLAICNVLVARSVAEIVRSIILGVAVDVTNVISGRSFTYEGEGNKDVRFEMERQFVASQIKTEVSKTRLKTLPDGLLDNFLFGLMPSVSVPQGSTETLDAPQIGSFVSREAGDRKPSLVAIVGLDHLPAPDATYCLTVSGNHNMVCGNGANIICSNCDDPNNPMEVESDAIRNSTVMWFTEILPDRLNDQTKSSIIVIQQRTHEDDVSGIALSREMGYTHLMIPMRYDPGRHCVTVLGIDDEGNEKTWSDPRKEDGELAWPERFPAKIVDELERDKGPHAFAGQYMQSPEPRGGSIIKRETWQVWDQEKFPTFEYVIGSLDTAYTTKEENDPSALTIWGVFRDPRPKPVAVSDPDFYRSANMKVMLMWAWQGRLEFNELIEEVMDTCTIAPIPDVRRAKRAGRPRFPVQTLLIEAKAAGLSVGQEMYRLMSNRGAPLSIYFPNINKGRYTQDKVARLHSVEHIFAAGMVYAPDRAWADMVINQVSVFPKGSHDDLCFVAGTMVATRRGLVPIETIECGEAVLTPDGWRRVLASGPTGRRHVVERAGLVGTPGHPIFCLDGGYRAIDTVTHADEFIGLSLCDLLKTALLKSLFSMAFLTEGWAASADIISHNRLKIPVDGGLKVCMSLFGNFIQDNQFRLAMRFIIRTTTYSILSLKIWSAYRAASIVQCLRKIWIDRSNWRIWGELGGWLVYGTNRMRAALGIAPLVLNFWTKPEQVQIAQEFAGPKSVSGVVENLNSKIRAQFFVGPNAKGNTVDIEEVAISSSTPILPVYNLTVEGAACYFANGVLVHNCDTVSQALTYLRESGILERPDEQSIEDDRILAYRERTTPLYTPYK